MPGTTAGGIVQTVPRAGFASRTRRRSVQRHLNASLAGKWVILIGNAGGNSQIGLLGSGLNEIGLEFRLGG